MDHFCHSCAAHTDSPEFKGVRQDFCKYCTDTEGKLYPQETVQKGIAKWLKTWQPHVSDDEALDRAAHYMRAMPAWAKKT